MTPLFRAPRPEGSALVIMLAFLVLLTAVTLAFYSRAMLDRQIAESTTNQTVVNVLADSATEVVVGNLRAEMLVSSTLVTTNGARLLFPLAISNAVPVRIGTADSLPNLVRRSSRDDTVTPAQGGAAASPANSATASQNGRSISAARWNSHYLLPRQNPTNAATDPVGEFVPPDWVYVTRTGPARLTAPRTNVIGRYAFAIYDEGGLLDANVAGYPAGVPAEWVGEKGSAALADLRALGLPSADALVGWRNRVSLGVTNQSLADGYNFAGDAALGTNYVRKMRAITNGFLTVSGSMSPDGATDQRWNTRQALIRFFKTQNLPLDALQYLGTFSRDLEQPSFRPDPARPKNTMADVNAGGNSAYNLQDQINPWILAARTPSGEPRVRRRFPLSRLAQVKRNPTPAQAEAIKEQFGLVWDAANAWWRYADKTDDSKSATEILRLDQISGEREPDFFELLKAGIVCDSLGKQHGGNDFAPSPTLYGGSAEGADGKIDYQVLQIGAAIIDQYDDDSYPTRILFDDDAALPYRRLFFGVEDIPCLYGWMSTWYRLRLIPESEIDPDFKLPAEANGALPYETGVLLQPILWNPHAASGPPVGGAPDQFEVVAGAPDTTLPISTYPRVVSAWWNVGFRDDGGQLYSNFVHEFPADSGKTTYPATISPALSWLRFDLPSPAAFREPVRLASPSFPAGINLTAPASGALTPIDTHEMADTSTASEVVMGIYMGGAWTGPFSFTSTTAGPHESDLRKRSLSSGFLNRDLRLELRFRNPDATGPAYLSYSVIDLVPLRDLNAMSTVASDDSVSRLRGMRSGFKADPRSNRWGQFCVNTCPFWDARATPATGVTLPAEDSNSPIYFLPQGLTTSPGASYLVRTMGNQSGRVPRAPGWEYPLLSPLRQLPGDLMANLSGNKLVNASAGTVTSSAPGAKFFYTDPDAVLRRADGGAFSDAEGLAAYSVSNYPLPDGTVAAGTGSDRSRPKILNRAFTSVADLGYAFRGVAWRSLDLAFPESGDSALLDLFCLQETDAGNPVVAGRVNLNTRQPKVIEAILRGVSKAQGVYLSDAEAERIAAALVAWTSSPIPERGPLRNRSELVGRWQSRVNFPNPRTAGYNIEGALSYAGFSSQLDPAVFSSQADASIVERRESVMRALTDAGTARTWNLMIDLVAQSGRFGPGAPSLDAFQVQSETRRWIHVALDRMTGEVVAREVETIVE
jgi:Tfp pilus assembly protein PilX